MTRLYVAIGLPGGGKSYTWEKEYNYATYISSDALREEMFGDVNEQSHNDMIFNEMMNRTVASLNASKDCYYDATNLNQKRRIKFLNALRDRVYVEFDAIALVFAIPFDACVRRNLNRERTVPYEIMDRMYKSFQVPDYCEGWSEIKFIHNGDDKVLLDKVMEILKNTSHDNPHHSLTIGDHMEAAYEYAVKQNFPAEVCTAVLYHDIGKLRTKTFTDSKGRPSSVAHYYGHNSVGAYDYITGADATLDTIEIANLIQLHMSFYDGENRLRNIKRLYGDDFYEKLEMLHECDMNSH